MLMRILLQPCDFDCAVFCPNFASTYSKKAGELTMA